MKRVTKDTAGGMGPGRVPSTLDGETRALRQLRGMSGGEVVVSLPRKWLQSQRLQAGNQVALHRIPGDGILVAPSLRRAPQDQLLSMEVEGDERPEYLFRRLIAAYLGGYDTIRLRHDEMVAPEIRKVVKEFVRRVAHFEVVEEGRESVVLKDMGPPEGFSTGALLRRMAQLTRAFLTESGECLGKGTLRPDLSRLPSRDDEVDRLAWWMERVLLRRSIVPVAPSGPASWSQGVHHLLAARGLERISDHAIRLIGESERLNQGAVPGELRLALQRFHAEVMDLFAEAAGLLDAPDPLRANQLIDRAEGIHSERAALWERFLLAQRLPRLPSSVAATASLLLESMDRIASYSADLAELTLDIESSAHGLPNGNLLPETGAPSPSGGPEEGSQPSQPDPKGR